MSTSSSRTFSRSLKELTEEALTTCSGSLFHELITLWLKKYFLSCSLASLHFQLPLVAAQCMTTAIVLLKKSSIFSESKPFTIRKTWIKSPLTLLFSKDVIPSNFSLSSYDLRFIYTFDQFSCPALNILQTLNVFSQIRQPDRHSTLDVT